MCAEYVLLRAPCTCSGIQVLPAGRLHRSPLTAAGPGVAASVQQVDWKCSSTCRAGARNEGQQRDFRVGAPSRKLRCDDAHHATHAPPTCSITTSMLSPSSRPMSVGV